MTQTATEKSTVPVCRTGMRGSRFTILGILKEAEGELKALGIQNPRLDAEMLLSMSLKLDRTGLYTEYDRTLTEEEVDGFFEVLERRLKREPIQYILRSCEFYGLEFLVTPDVLIPRPETELLVEEAIKRFTVHSSRITANGSPRPRSAKRGGRFTVLDLCTGSGCIAIALAKKLEGAKIYAVDISERALRVVKENARRHGVESRIDFIQGDLFGPFTVHGSRFTVHDYRFDLIVSNPPYIPSHEIDSLQSEVRDYEPRVALNGGPDGLLYLKKIIEDAPGYLRSGGSLLLEIGEGQRERIYEIVEEKGIYLRPEIIKDFAGIERVLKLHTV